MLAMFFRSLFYERTILRYLERVEQLPAEVQAEIAMRVGSLIELARPVSDYHRQADVCVRMALSASSQRERVRLMEVANIYRDRASRAETFGRDAGQVGRHVVAADKHMRSSRDRSRAA
jgi:hypothetical protein